ncbi:hypothetical protein [Nocardia sp. XZ_19_385]|uniref:hypothetical protein n=1 Tax=Nocardia sp. XZ_19_385 TaxID=2769488 RepID=UPI00188F73CF|nr:hypothetical protein [Nocardia sp. XZ_19_385]
MTRPSFDALIAQAELRYAPELRLLLDLGFDARVRVVGHVNIHIPLKDVRGGIPVEMLVCNGDGLILDDEEPENWCAAVYSSHDGSPLDIFCHGDHVEDAVRAAAALLESPVRVAVRTPEHCWHDAILPVAALGDRHAEAVLLAPQSCQGPLRGVNVIVLDDDVTGWVRGCSTHSACQPIERRAAAVAHRDCAHALVQEWADSGRLVDWTTLLPPKRTPVHTEPRPQSARRWRLPLGRTRDHRKGLHVPRIRLPRLRRHDRVGHGRTSRDRHRPGSAA